MYDLLIIFCAKYLIYLPPLALLAALYYRKRKWPFLIFSLSSLALTYALGALASLFWYDPRPFVVENFAPLVAHAANNGFPSGHMLLAAGVASIAFYYNRTLGLWMWLVAVIIGLARVLAGVHYAVDIFSSIAIAIASVYIVRLLFKTVHKRV